MISYLTLSCLEAFILFLLVLRVYVVTIISPQVAFILAIFATFVATAETEVESQIQEPGSILSVSIVFKVVNAMLVIVVFTLNGNINDYFVLFFFMSSCILGRDFFYYAGFS